MKWPSGVASQTTDVVAATSARYRSSLRASSASLRLRCVMSRLMEEAPTTTPEESHTGETVSAMLIRVPSFRIRTVSAKSTRSPRRMWSRRSRSESCSSAGIRTKIDCPSISRSL